MSLELLGAVTPAKHNSDRAKAAGQRAVTAGKKIAKRAPRLSKAIVAAGQRALGGPGGRAAPSNKRPELTVGPKRDVPAQAPTTVALPPRKGVVIDPGRLASSTPTGPVFVPRNRAVPLPPRANQAAGVPVLNRAVPRQAPVPRALPAATPSGPRANVAQPRRSHIGNDLPAGTGPPPQTEDDPALADLADAAANVAGFVYQIQELIDQLPPGEMLAARGQNIIDNYSMTFGATFENALSSGNVSTLAQDAAMGFRAIMESQSDTSRPPWDWFVAVDTYLQAHPAGGADEPANGPGAEQGVPALVTVSPPSVMLIPGQGQPFSATVTDAAGKAVAPRSLSWSTSAGATIDPSGNFVAAQVGNYTVTATADGLTGTASVSVQESATQAPPPAGGGGDGSAPPPVDEGYDQGYPPDPEAQPDPFVQEEYAPEEYEPGYGDPFAQGGGGSYDPFAQDGRSDAYGQSDAASRGARGGGIEYVPTIDPLTEEGGTFSEDFIDEPEEDPGTEQAADDSDEGDWEMDGEEGRPLDLMGRGGGGHGGGPGGRGGRGGHGRRRGYYGGGPYFVYGGAPLELLSAEESDGDFSLDEIAEAAVRRLNERALVDHVVVGSYDIAQSRRQMNTLKQITVSVARALLRGGQQVAAATIETAQGGLFERELPVVNTLRGTQGHLQWHAGELAKQSDPTAMYAPGEDLKKWVMQAYVDSNAVEEGRAAQEQIWQDMWTEIGDAISKLPPKIVGAVVSAPGQVFQGLTGIPSWVFWTGGAVLVCGLGVGAWKLLLATAPAIGGAVARRYLP